MTDSINGFRLMGEQTPDLVPKADDMAKPDPNALSVARLETWLDEIKLQPQWRKEADKCCEYYDGNQLDADTISRLEDKGLGPLITNLVAPTINAVLGMEAKTRTDWRVGADDERFMDVAEALSAKLHEAERESQADRANSDAYAAMVKVGFGAVEVSRESNPFRYPYRVSYIHRSEIFWDWHSRMPDWSDARYVVRKKQYDADVLASFFPDRAEIIKSAGKYREWSDFLTLDARMSADLLHDMGQGHRMSWDDLGWRDTTRNRVTCFEVWYRVYVRGLVLKLPFGRVIEFNSDNPVHRAVVASGAVQPQVAVFDKIRCAFYCGPIRLLDYETNKRRFPYIPFFGYREDLTGVPYGIIRSMLSPQDEVNARTAKMMYLLNSRRTIIDSDALDSKYNTMSDASREVGRADGFIVLNPTSQRGTLRIEDNGALSQQQFMVMQERKQAIQEAAGVYSAMMGQNSNASSGTAIQSLVEQGVTTLAEINDNYRLARRLVGEELLSLIKEDTTDEMDIMVDTGTAKRRIVVNIPKVNPDTGIAYKENDVQVAPVRVALQDVPSTPTYRAQQFAQMSEILKSLSPQYQALLTPFVIEMTDFAHRKEIAEFLRKQTGIVMDQNSPQAQAAAQQQAQMQQMQMEAAMQDMQSKIAERQARAQKLLAEAQKVQAEIGGTSGDENAGRLNEYSQRLQQMQAEIDRLRLQLADKSADRDARLTQTAMQQRGATERLIMQIEAEKANALMQQYADIEADIGRTIASMRNPSVSNDFSQAQGYGQQPAGNGTNYGLIR